MKRIDAVIRPERLEQVKARLSTLDIQGATAAEVRGFGRQKGHTEMYRGTEYTVDFVPKVKIEIAVPEAMLNQIIDTILRTAHTGQIGDGKIFVSELLNVIRIRTGEKGSDAL